MNIRVYLGLDVTRPQNENIVQSAQSVFWRFPYAFDPGLRAPAIEL
eukprot:SAG22_NODE_20837_length_262_cov_0.797546_1_plen_45_part_10